MRRSRNEGCYRSFSPRNDHTAVDLILMAETINILEKPIERIRETCEMTGAAEKLERVLPELETYLEGEIAAGETNETRLTFDGLCFLKRAFSRL